LGIILFSFLAVSLFSVIYFNNRHRLTVIYNIFSYIRLINYRKFLFIIYIMYTFTLAIIQSGFLVLFTLFTSYLVLGLNHVFFIQFLIYIINIISIINIIYILALWFRRNVFGDGGYVAVQFLYLTGIALIGEHDLLTIYGPTL